ncbi:MAG: PQQ-binding-like beta-propeller repeat protein [Planctomycetota bacterium]|nr:PQQ-binding-like beta-propeller repeat protein [Planctomycetota bacterium]
MTVEKRLNRIRPAAMVLVVTLLVTASLQADDWPMWRYNAARSNASPEALPDELHLSWTLELPKTRPAWPASQTKLQFDSVHQPIVVGDLLVLGSTVHDSITAYETDSGEEAWRFYTEGPVRFAPAASRDRIYATSDDGYLYCLHASTGSLLWKVRGGPDDRRIIGNERLISMWPIRGGPVLIDDTVYFTAGIWPFMGIFVHAVDAETGRAKWINSETGSRWVTHPHGAPSFGSIVPQGYLAAIGDRLLVPGGRSLPGVFDRKTGEMEYFDFGGKGSGGWSVVAHENFYVVENAAFAMQDGASLGSFPVDAMIGEIAVGNVTAHDLSGAVRVTPALDRKGEQIEKVELKPAVSWAVSSPDMPVFMVAGKRAYAGRDGIVAAFDIEAARQADKLLPPQWSVSVEGTPLSMIAGDNKLFVITGTNVQCFSAAKTTAVGYAIPDPVQTLPKAIPIVDAMLDRDPKPEGYALILGIGSLDVAEQLVARTDLHVVAVDSDADKVDALRRRMSLIGVSGTRVAAINRNLSALTLPPYFANVVTGDVPDSAGEEQIQALVHTAYQALRPYDGFACWELTQQQHDAVAVVVASGEVANAELSRDGSNTFLTRVGPLPGSGSWTHQYADATNSVVSSDSIVQAPLGLLWFGGPPNDKVLPRHGHGPSPQVAGGRLVIEGADMLRCVDVYTGRVFWEKDLPGLGTYYDTTRHFPGAGEIGSNYVTLPDAVYVVYRDAILHLDAATGETIRKITLDSDAVSVQPTWGYLAAEGDLLIATSSPVSVSDDNQPTDSSRINELLSSAQYSSSSRQLVVMDRHSGKVLWTRSAEYSFRHNAIAAAGDRIFCIDSLSDVQFQTLQRRGLEPPTQPRLFAFDAKSGELAWSTSEDVFGTFLNYSREHDVLLQAGSAYRDRAKDEAAAGMVAYRGRDGDVLWKDLSLKHSGPCLLWRDRIITNGGGGFELDLLTGKTTGWNYKRMYGCNTAVGSEYLLTFRSGAAGFCDLAGDSGTGNIGGFRSSCTANLIAADGVLNAPDYTRTCVCAYQNQCSLALIHMPAVEQWTFSNLDHTPDEFAVNLGAPGDHRGPDGSMWYDQPSVGGNSPDLPIKISGDAVRSIRHHSSRIAPLGNAFNWVASSGVVGIESIEQKLAGDSNRSYTVRLTFAELEGRAAGERVFDVSIEGKPVLEHFDIAAETGGPLRGIVRQFTGITGESSIQIRFRNIRGEATLSGLQIVPE